MKFTRRPPSKPARTASDPATLVSEVRELILSSRQTVARGVNAALAILYWNIGRRIRTEILRHKRAEYGQEILSTLSGKLAGEFGRGFSQQNLFRMVEVFTAFPDEQILATLSRELGWSHFVELLPLKKPLQRDFYAEMCRVERWSVRTLRQKIDGMLYERTAGQMEFYLRWLKKHEMQAGEQEPIGLILCAEKSDERIELFELAQRGIRVSEYLTELPPKKLLEQKLHEAVCLAQSRLARSKTGKTP